jgi:hypothetical protein
MTDLIYPLDSFEYEQDKLDQWIRANYWHKLERAPLTAPHIGSEGIRQEILEQHFPILCSNIRKYVYDDVAFFGRAFFSRPISKGDPHIDFIGSSDTAREWSLNIPVANCLKTYHEWFKIDEPGTKELHNYAVFWRGYQDEDGPVFKYELNVPTILKVSVPHRINNPLDSTRIILAIRTEDNRFRMGQ